MLLQLKRTLAVIFILASSILPHYAQAWGDTGHMLVAQIAYNNMTEAARCHANKLIEAFKDTPETATFVTAACWPDDIKGRGVKTYNSWHNMNLPYAPHFKLNQRRLDFIKLELQHKFDIKKALVLSKAVLEDPRESLWNKAFMFRFFIHLVGDAHQPLHVVSFYSPRFRTGDRGGSLFELKGRFHNLHSLWDDMGDLSARKPHRPLSKHEALWLARKATNIARRYPPQKFSGKINAPVNEWLKESYQKAVRFAYRGIKPFELPSRFYLRRTQRVTEESIALAGYRLAAILNRLFTVC